MEPRGLTGPVASRSERAAIATRSTSAGSVTLDRVPFMVTMLLADAAQAVDGKLYILGGGWSVTGPMPAPSAIALYIKVPWDEANVPHSLQLELLDHDGGPILVDTPLGEQALRIESGLEVGRPPGIKPGTALDVALAITIPPLPLVPGSGYVWRLAINGEGHTDWSLPFSVRQSVPQPD